SERARSGRVEASRCEQFDSLLGCRIEIVKNTVWKIVTAHIVGQLVDGRHDIVRLNLPQTNARRRQRSAYRGDILPVQGRRDENARPNQIGIWNWTAAARAPFDRIGEKLLATFLRAV